LGRVVHLPILLQKSFWNDERKFLEPLMRFPRGDVRDHIVFIQNQSPASVMPLTSDAAVESSEIDFGEIFWSFDSRLLQQYLPILDMH
jgi:hypothetical protein